MMQLYLDGPKDKFFNIFSPPDQSYFKEFKKEGFFNIENYTPSGLLKKQFESVIEVFREKKIFHRIIYLKNHDDPLNLIELFSYFILETILLGKVLDINPYDQPAVQLIKEKIFKS
jgi:glucose-6-phosphate isomerase